MAIRVIAGKAKGKILRPVPGDITRPIMDRVKEALFNILGTDIWDAIFVDLFAGTGSVGIEALSRGAARAYFYDLERAAVKTIQYNLALTRLSAQAVVRQADALTVLQGAPPEPVDYIYIAPPQYRGLWLRTLELLDKASAWLAQQPIVIVQIDPTEQLAVALRSLQPYDERRYGNTLLWFFETKSLSESGSTATLGDA
ncbi:MAG: 16S rRNA (guanine(966)-N(2))-methyltransferase RsmD [Anaerolinea sp.]|nr:16S rRNA (guanine(966)-N(2))-methyltransferase RsmD [Anaerolinea sp.]